MTFQVTTGSLSKALMTPLFVPLFLDHGTSILSRSSFPGFSFQHWTLWQETKPLFASTFKFLVTTHLPCLLLHLSSKIWHLIYAAVFFSFSKKLSAGGKNPATTDSCNRKPMV